jgi:hypothetical protein
MECRLISGGYEYILYGRVNGRKNVLRVGRLSSTIPGKQITPAIVAQESLETDVTLGA